MLNRGVVETRRGSGNQRVAHCVLEEASVRPFPGNGNLSSLYMVVTAPFQTEQLEYPYLGLTERIFHPDGGHQWFRALRMRGTLSLDFQGGSTSPAEAWRALSTADWFPHLSITVSIVALNRDLTDEPLRLKETLADYIETDGMMSLKLPSGTGKVIASYRCLAPGWPVHREDPIFKYTEVDQTTGTVTSEELTVYSQVQGWHAERLIDVDMNVHMSDLQDPTFAICLQYRANNNVVSETELRSFVLSQDYRVTFNGTLFGYPDPY